MDRPAFSTYYPTHQTPYRRIFTFRVLVHTLHKKALVSTLLGRLNIYEYTMGRFIVFSDTFQDLAVLEMQIDGINSRSEPIFRLVYE